MSCKRICFFSNNQDTLFSGKWRLPIKAHANKFLHGSGQALMHIKASAPLYTPSCVSICLCKQFTHCGNLLYSLVTGEKRFERFIRAIRRSGREAPNLLDLVSKSNQRLERISSHNFLSPDTNYRRRQASENYDIKL